MEVHLRICAVAIATAWVLLSPAEGEAGPRRPATDCLASWASRECHDDDGACDLLAGPGCLMQTSVCFNNGPGDEVCPHREIDAVRIQRPLFRSARGALAQALVDALVDIGGTEDSRSVSFSEPPTARCVSFEAVVPRKGKRSGHATLATKTKAGRASDGDRTRFICHPPDPTSDHAPPLSSGCRSSMDQAECEAHDGDFDPAAGALQLPHCFCRTDDFGEVCDHNPQCQGVCLAADPDATTGTCSEHASVFGCFLMFLRDGVVDQICID